MAAKRNGFTIVESLMAVLMFTMSGLAFSSFVTISASRQSQNKTKLSVTQARSQILGLIGNRAVWSKNLALAGVSQHPVYKDKTLNPELACLRDGTACTEKDTGYDLTLTDQSGNIIVDAIDTTKGLTIDGAVCSGYSDTAPNSRCPWRMALRWKPACAAGGSCLHPQVTIEVSVTATPSFLQSNNLTNTQVSLMLEQPKTVPPFAKKISMITNSVHYGYPTSVEIDPTPYVVSDSPGKITFSIPKTTSVMGGTVGMNGQKLTYSPAYNISPVPTEQIYGTDWFLYKIKDSYTGVETMATVYVSVMTPYTWTGLASGGDKSISNKKNFCGKVINGVCDGATFPTTFLLTANPDSNLVFNEACTNCDVDIGTTIKVSSLETSPYFSGTITQKANVEAGNYGTSTYGWSVWRRLNSFEFSGGTWDGQSGQLFVPRPGEKNIAWGATPKTYGYFRVDSGIFKAPPDLTVTGSIYIANASSFKHNSGIVNWMSKSEGAVRCAGDCLGGADSVEFNNLVVGWPKASFAEASKTVNGYLYTYGNQSRSYIESNFSVLGTLTVANAGESMLATPPGVALPKVVSLYGDLVASPYNSVGDYSYGSLSTIQLVGKGDQTIIGQPLSAADRQDVTKANCMPSIVVDKPSGKITVKDTIALGGDFILKNAGSYDMQNVNLLGHGWNYAIMKLDLNGQAIDGLYYTATKGHEGSRIQLASDITVKSMFYYDPYVTVGNPFFFNVDATPRYVNIQGDMIVGPNARESQNANPSTFRFNGTGNQTVTAQMDGVRSLSNSILVEKPSGTLNFAAGKLGFVRDFFVTSGTVTFDPGFELYAAGTAGNSIQTRFSFWDPANQVLPQLTLNNTTQLMSAVTVNTLAFNQHNDANSLSTGFSPVASAFPLNVKGDLLIGENSAASYPNVNGGPQQILMNGTGAQRILFNGNTAGVINGSTIVANSIDIQVLNTGMVASGKGTIGKLTVGAGTTLGLVDSTVTTALSLTGTVAGTLNKNGRMSGGSMTVVGGGVINN